MTTNSKIQNAGMTVQYPSDIAGRCDTGTLVDATRLADGVYSVTIQTSPNPADTIKITVGADSITTPMGRPVSLD